MAELAPWLTQQADPIGSFLKGAQAGGIIASTRQRQQQINMEGRLNEARMQEIALDAKLKAASYDYTMQQRAAEADLASAYSAIGDLEGGWSNPDAIKVLAQVGVSHPAIIGSQLWQHGQENIFKATTLKNQAAQIESLNNYRIEQEKGRNLRAQEANDVKLQIEQAKLDLATDPNNAQNQFKLANLYARLQGLDIAAGNLQQREAGTELRRNAAVQGAVTKEADLAEKGFAPTVPLMPPGTAGAPAAPQGASMGQPLVTPTARPTTAATTTVTQESLRNLSNSYNAVQRTRQMVESNPEAFGPLGGARQLLETARGLLSPGQGAPVTAARATADVAAEDIIRGLKQDAQMSLYEKKQLDRLARITGPWENPDTAKAKLSVLGAGLAGKAIRDVKILGPNPPEWAQRIAIQAQKAFEKEADLTVYTDAELADAVRDGYISQEVGLAEFESRRKK